MLGTSSSLERLPVVELRPFVSRQWLPSKSRPDFNDRSLTSLSGFSSSSQMSTATSHSYSPRRKHGMAMDTKRQTAQRSVSLPPSKLSAKQYYHQESPRLRAEDIFSTKDFPPPVNSEADSINLQTMEILGQRIKNDRKGNLSLFHSNHWEYYKNTRSEPTRSVANISRQMSPDMESIRTRIEHLENNYVDDSIYDNFDKANTLPSISVQTAPMRRRKGRYDRNPSAKVPGKAPYTLGVANSLDVLSHFGQPARVERHLTMQLKHTIQQLRRTKDNKPGARILYKVENYPTSVESLMRMSTDASQDHTPVPSPRKQTGFSESRTIPEEKQPKREDSAVSKKLAVMIPPASTDTPMPSPAVQESDTRNGTENVGINIEASQEDIDTEVTKNGAIAQPTDDENGNEYESSHSGVTDNKDI